MASGGGGFLVAPLGDSLAAFALPDVPRKPLPATAPPREISETPRAAAVTPAPVPAAEAKALVEKTCGVQCHSLDMLEGQRMTEPQWKALVRKMVSRGAEATEDEMQVIANYLAKTQGK